MPKLTQGVRGPGRIRTQVLVLLATRPHCLPDRGICTTHLEQPATEAAGFPNEEVSALFTPLQYLSDSYWLGAPQSHFPKESRGGASV